MCVVDFIEEAVHFQELWMTTRAAPCRAYRIALSELSRSSFPDCPHWLGQVTIYARVVEIELVGDVIAQHPGKHWVLRKVIERPPGQRVKRHEILEVRTPSTCTRTHCSHSWTITNRAWDTPHETEGW